MAISRCLAGNFIVVFKKGVTPDQITEYINQVNKSGAYCELSRSRSIIYSLAGGEVTHRFDPGVLNVIRCNTFPVLNALMDFFF